MIRHLLYQILRQVKKHNVLRVKLLKLLNRVGQLNARAVSVLQPPAKRVKLSSPLSITISPAELVNRLEEFDVISFDIFDTLLFRYLNDPKQVFEVLGLLHNKQLFKKIRVEAERDCRELSKSGDTTLEEIYSLVSERISIDKTKSMKMEEEAELFYCFPNPYMQEVFNLLKSKNKRIIATSDMYLSKETIQKLLISNGFDGFEEIFVSSDVGGMKQTGKLFEIVKERLGHDVKVAHIGDNLFADIQIAEKHGWSTIHYKNVNQLNKSFSVMGMSSIGGSLYNGIVNAFTSNPNIKLNDPFFIFGFKYLGWLVCLYCEWLNEQAEQCQATKILFPSRDMFIVSQIYEKYFRKFDSEYVYISRIASIRMDILNSREILLDYIKADINSPKKYKIKEILDKLNFSFLEDRLPEYELDPCEGLSKSSYQRLRKMILSETEVLTKYCNSTKQSAEEYFSKVVQGHEHVLFADTNGRCTSLFALSHILEKFHCRATGAFLYSVTGPGFVEAKLLNGSLRSYLFSFDHNRNIYKDFQKKWESRTSILEAVFSAPTGTLVDYVSEDGDSEFQFSSRFTRREYLVQIQNGIEAFVEKYLRANCPPYHFTFPAQDAVAPLSMIIDSADLAELFSSSKESMELVGK